MNTSPETSDLKYVWFADHLRRQIETGELQRGDKLPSRAQIRELHNLTQPTVDRALDILEREGLIVRRERQGVFVAEAEAPVANSASSAQPGLGSRTVGIFTSNDGQLRPTHFQMGWSDFITQGALAACREWNKHVLLLDPRRLDETDFRQIAEAPPLGFVFAFGSASADFDRIRGSLEGLQRRGHPVVVFGNEAQFANFDRVACDHEVGCYELTRWLIRRGHQRILPFWPPQQPGMDWLASRLAGYQRAMTEVGLEPLPVRSVPRLHSPFNPDATAEAFEATARHKAGYLADCLDCDAILDVTDGDVYSTAAALRLLGRVPNRDVVIAGYDNYWRDVYEARFEPSPPIATVDKHNWLTGSELVKVLLARVQGRYAPEPQLHWIKPTVVPWEETPQHSNFPPATPRYGDARLAAAAQ